MTIETVTSETLAEFNAARLPRSEEPPADEPEAKTEGKSESNTAEKPKTKPIQPRITELVAERNSARDEAERAKQEAESVRAELDEIKRKLQILETPAPQKEQSARPERSQFATQDDYDEALTDWKVEKRLAEQAKAEADARRAAAQAQLVENWKARQDSIRSELDDYDAVVGAAEIQMPQWMLDAIVEAEHGPRVAYYLAKNTADAKRLLSMTPTSALRELGKLEDRLVAKIGKEEGKTAVEKSKAPEPLETLKGSSIPTGKEPSKMSYEEWKAARIAGKIK